MGAGGEAETGDGVLQEFFAVGGNRTVFAKHLGHHLGVGIGLFFCAITFELPVPRGDDALPDGR